MLTEAQKDKFMRLTPVEAKLVRKPLEFAKSSTLDEKLMIAHKLGKRICIVVINDDVEINAHEFAKIFRYTFFSEERNEEAMELIDEKGVVVIGGESIARWMQRTELFLSSDLVEISRAIKKLKNKKAINNFNFDNKESDLKDLFMHTITRMYFASLKFKSFTKFFAINEKEFAILCIIWMSGRPMSNEGIRVKLESLVGKEATDLRSPLKHLALKKYVRSVPKEATHVKSRTMLWMLTEAGHDCIDSFVKKITNETISTIYE